MRVRMVANPVSPHRPISKAPMLPSLVEFQGLGLAGFEPARLLITRCLPNLEAP